MPRHARPPETQSPPTRGSASSPSLAPDPPPVPTSQRPSMTATQPTEQPTSRHHPPATGRTPAITPEQKPPRPRTTNHTPRRRTAPALHEARNLPATLSLIEAGRWLGIGRTSTYQMAQDGSFPIRTLHLGRQLRVATCDLLDYLDITIPYPDETPPAATA